MPVFCVRAALDFSCFLSSTSMGMTSVSKDDSLLLHGLMTHRGEQNAMCQSFLLIMAISALLYAATLKDETSLCNHNALLTVHETDYITFLS